MIDLVSIYGCFTDNERRRRLNYHPGNFIEVVKESAKRFRDLIYFMIGRCMRMIGIISIIRYFLDSEPLRRAEEI